MKKLHNIAARVLLLGLVWSAQTDDDDGYKAVSLRMTWAGADIYTQVCRLTLRPTHEFA